VFTSVSPGPHLINIYDDNDCTNLTTTVLVLNYRNYFTPNGDSFHNTWNISGLEAQPNAIIRIYDRYGKFLKQIKPNGPGWDGTYNGNLVPSTDYWFEVDYYEKDSTGMTVLRKFKSHFSLLR
jgi:gliding motility-associated-like protein